MRLIEIYTDGACSGNPGPGGFAAILLYKQIEGRWRKLEISGGVLYTTNNRMELTAVIEASRRLKNERKNNIKVYSDSLYLINAFKQAWIHSWRIKNWYNSKRIRIANIDLWEELFHFHKKNNVDWVKVKAHSGNKYNEICDTLAVIAKKDQRNTSKYSWLKDK